MEKDYKKEIEEILGQMRCPKDFECYRSGLGVLCRAKEIGLETFLECSEDNPRNCKFSIPFADMYLCECPLRIYIAKKLKK
jgi:hypothetical protein